MSAVPAASPSLPEYALYKAWVLWRGGIKKTFYSYDTSGRYKVLRPNEYGLRGLQKRVAAQYPDRIVAAIIYNNQTGTPLYRFQGGEWNAYAPNAVPTLR